MKKLVLFAMVIAGLSIFNACEKSNELEVRQPTDNAQSQEAIKPGVYSENGYLVFKDFETLDSLKKVLNTLTTEELNNFEKEFGFTSAYSYRMDFLNKSDGMNESELINHLAKVSNEGYFDQGRKEFVYPFYNESYAKLLNPNGKVKIDKTFYQFKGDVEIIKPDLSGVNYDGDASKLTKEIQLHENKGLLKSGEMLKETMLSDNRLRSLLQLKRERFDVYDLIIDPFGGIVWGLVGYNWEVYYRFYSYKQYRLYKSDRPTYFNWKTKKAQIGGNNGFWYLNDYNSNPQLERSTSQQAVFHFRIYKSGLTQTSYTPTISSVQVSDFWSDYMSSFHGSLIYP